MDSPKLVIQSKSSIPCKRSNCGRTISIVLGLEMNRKKRRKNLLKSALVRKMSYESIIKSNLVKDCLLKWAMILFHIMKLINLKSTSSFSYITVILFLISSSRNVCCEQSPCDLNQWWSQFRNTCLPCSECPSGMIPIRPCEFHRDTICGSISDLKIDWISGKAEPNWKERRKNDYDSRDIDMDNDLNHGLYLSGPAKEEALLLDWITIAFFIAATICLILFVIAAFILFYHMRQWRKIEESLTNDVEELSSKFLTKFAEVQRVDAGAFLIRSSDSLRYPGYQAQYVLLPAKHLEHQSSDRRYVAKSVPTGNVYIEEI